MMMDAKEDMINDAMDDAMEDEGDEEETEEVVNQVSEPIYFNIVILAPPCILFYITFSGMCSVGGHV